MSSAATEEARIVHKLPGRVRVCLPGWEGQRQRALEARLRGMRGVNEVRSSTLTRNVLVHFNPDATDGESVLEAVRTLEPDAGEGVEEEPEAPPVQRERRGSGGGRASRCGGWTGIRTSLAGWWSGWRAGCR
jgi:hypothetical protein